MKITYVQIPSINICCKRRVFSLANSLKIQVEIQKLKDIFSSISFIDFLILDCGDAVLDLSDLNNIYLRHEQGFINSVVIVAKSESKQIPFNMFKTLGYNSSLDKELSFIIVNHKIANEEKDLAPLRKKTSNLLLSWGFSAQRVGMRMLVDIVVYMLENNIKMGKLYEIYDKLKSSYDVSSACIEVNIRVVIKKAYNSSMLPFFKTCPTNKEFINYIAMYLSNEVFDY